MSEVTLTKEDFEEIEASVTKKLRNKKKKLEKIVQTENKIVSKEIKPTQEQQSMVDSKPKVEGQIKELEEMRKSLHKECQKVLKKHNHIVKALKSGEANQDATIRRTLGVVADALLVNLLQNEYNVTNLLRNEERVGLEALMIPVKSLIQPSADQLIYSRARECFVELFSNFVVGKSDIIPGSDTTYRKLLSDIQNIPAEVRNHTHKLDAEETAAEDPASPEQHHVEVSREAPISSEAQRVTNWNVEEEEEQPQEEAEDEPVEEEKQEVLDDATLEKLAEQDALKENIRVKPTAIKPKEYIDEDGFTHVKPHARPESEHNSLRGRGRRGKKRGRHGETDRLKVRGGKNPRGRGRGGRGGHHDKHDVDEHGRKTKTAHGHGHWKKGEVRNDQNLQ